MSRLNWHKKKIMQIISTSLYAWLNVGCVCVCVCVNFFVIFFFGKWIDESRSRKTEYKCRRKDILNVVYKYDIFVHKWMLFIQYIAREEHFSMIISLKFCAPSNRQKTSNIYQKSYRNVNKYLKDAQKSVFYLDFEEKEKSSKCFKFSK